MSVFTVVHRALHWKRQTIKAKSPDQDLSEKTPDATDPSTHRDVQIAVKPVHPQPAGIPAPDSDSSPARSGSVHARKRAQLVRAVSWASIVRSESRWTAEQESELVRAQRQLGKCQKAWSSEQEVWLSYVQALSEEKEARSGFLSLRHRQQNEEQHQFRKAWKRRRSSEEQQSALETADRLGKLRLPRYGCSGQRLGVGSTVVVKG